jgi:23S rRNA (uracil1939-C5)-methyltransferase
MAFVSLPQAVQRPAASLASAGTRQRCGIRPLCPLSAQRVAISASAAAPRDVESASSSNSPKARKAKAFKTGKKLSLVPFRAVALTDHAASVASSVESDDTVAPSRSSKPDAVISTQKPRYVLCPGCSTAYVGNTVTAVTQVVCPGCKCAFETSPEQLFIAVDTAANEAAAAAAAAAAQTAKRIAPRPDGISCRHFEHCSGCTLEDNVSRPPVARQAEAFARNALGFSKPLSVDIQSLQGWRTHAKLAIRSDGIGLFRTRSHAVVEIPDCAVHHPRINEAVVAVKAALKASGRKPYDEDSGKGGPRYALLTLERATGKVQVTIVWNSKSWKDAHPQATRVGSSLWNDNRDLIHSVWFNWNTSKGNVIASQKEDAYYLMHGDRGDVTELVCGAKVYFPPSVFRQGNLDAFEKLLLPKLLSYIPKKSAVVELFGGVGVISLAALARTDLELRSVVCTEINSFAHPPFRKSMRQFPKDVQDIARYIVGSDNDTVFEAVDSDADVDVVIVDPPRAGIAESCLDQLANPPRKATLTRLIYLSCGFTAFKRDSVALLAGSAGWKLTGLHGYVLFPGSDHVELLAIFSRQSNL